MRNMRMTAMLASGLVAGLVLGGIGIAAAQTSALQTPATARTHQGGMDATSSISPRSSETTEPETPSGDATPSVPAIGTVRSPMPLQSNGHAYGRMISHPNSGLHRGMSLGQARGSSAAHMNQGRHMGTTNSLASQVSGGNSGHMGGSMMGR